MQVLKQRVARKLRSKPRIQNPNQQLLFDIDQSPQYWQARYHDFNVYSRKRHVGKLRYMHPHPINPKSGLLGTPIAIR
jgi:hypothetical protein